MRKDKERSSERVQEMRRVTKGTHSVTNLLHFCNFICRGAQVERFITIMHQL